MIRLLLIRHAESEGNVKNIFQGSKSPLTERGVKQAQAIAERLKKEKIDEVYSSPTKRAKQTAEIINKYHKLKIKDRTELREREFGILKGKPSDNKKLPKKLREINKRRVEDEDYRIPGGESFNDIKKRVRNFIKEIQEKHKEKTVIVVGHNNTIRAFISILFNMHLRETYKFKPGNTSCTEIILNSKPKLVKSFCSKHLDPISQ